MCELGIIIVVGLCVRTKSRLRLIHVTYVLFTMNVISRHNFRPVCFCQTPRIIISNLAFMAILSHLCVGGEHQQTDLTYL